MIDISRGFKQESLLRDFAKSLEKILNYCDILLRY